MLYSVLIQSLLNSKHDVPGHLSDVSTRQHGAETVWGDDEVGATEKVRNGPMGLSVAEIRELR